MKDIPWLWVLVGALFAMFGLPLLMSLIGSLTGAARSRGSKEGM